MSAQSGVISFGKRPRGLGEHRGGYDSSHSWQGPEDLDVAVLALLAFIIALDGRQLIQQDFQARAAALALSVDQVQAGQQQGNMLSCGSTTPGATRSAGARRAARTSSAFRRRMRYWRSSRSMGFRCHLREFAQLNHQRIVQTNSAKAGPIGAQRVTQDKGIAAVVFGTSDSKRGEGAALPAGGRVKTRA
jgi:hypothetical protein